MDVPGWLKPFLWGLMFVIEVAGLLIRHVVLAVRLFANMLAGHIVLAVILGFILMARHLAPSVWASVTAASVAGRDRAEPPGTVRGVPAGVHLHLPVGAVHRLGGAPALTGGRSSGRSTGPGVVRGRSDGGPVAGPAAFSPSSLTIRGVQGPMKFVKIRRAGRGHALRSPRARRPPRRPRRPGRRPGAQVAAAGQPKYAFSDPRAIGVGLIIIGAAMGIGGLAKAAVESMARQPETAGNIQTAMIIAAALIEGVTFFALIIVMLFVTPY